MLLKSITLTGFKSFGARTTLDLDPGITVIVGPNGSGKSNIVDAVAWATGGQSTRGLRADRSDDLLFCGGAGLPPASRAEVTLVFDNASGLLPIDRPEVSITRRYYRSGESDFEINRAACRLMDITELLAEAGLRKSRYALVGQGQVDQILNASPVEHRRVLEEAAGVGKHLWRRDRAVRRLESTRSDLERVEDLIAEKHRRVRPLRRQAQALGRYQQLAGEIRSLRLFLEGNRLREIDHGLDAVSERRSRLESVRWRAEVERSRGLAALSTVESAQEALRTESASDALADWEMVSERMRRLSEVATLRAAAGRHRRQAERRRLALGAERQALERGLADLDGSVAAARVEVEESHNAVLRLSEEEQRLSALRQVDSEAEMGALLGERATLEAAAERDRRETEAVDGRLGELASLAEELDSEIAGMNPRLAEEESELRREEESLNQKALETREKRLELQAAEVRAAEARRAAAESSGRLEAARRTLRLEDPQRAKHLESFTGWTGWVSELLEVPEGLGAAVEAGLERWAEAAAFEGPVALGNAVHRLEEAAGVDGPVLMVTARFPDSSDSPARSVAAAGAGMTPLIELLEGDGWSDLAVRLLGDVVLVEDWKTGWEAVGAHPQLRAVTRQGDLITCRGVSLGGGKRLPDLAAASNAAREATTDSRIADQEVERLRAEADTLEWSHRAAGAALEERRAESLQRRQDLEKWEARRQEVGREQDRLRQRRGMVEVSAAAREARFKELDERIVRLRPGPTAAEDLERLSLRLAEVSKAREAAEAQHRDGTVALTRLGERRRLERARYEKVLVELSEAARLPVDFGVDHSEQVAEIATAALGMMASRRRVVADLDRAARRRAEELAGEAADARETIGRADRRQAVATGEMEDLIAEASRLEAHRQSIIESLSAMGADPALALGTPAPDTGHPEAVLASLAAEMERIRPINHYAATDLAQVESELSQLSGQHEDIVESARRLGKVISELEREATERYLVAFQETAAAFKRTFAQVFPGGSGRLSIVDRSDPLGSGVEITARPQGKRVSRLSLLSGGERALGALAFLFALMKTRPSPFYLLDEVDATLDATNLHRVLEIVTDLRANAQILIITHQPQTAEFAEVLYGVTMPPGGTTQVVSRRMDRAAAIRHLGTQARSA